MYLYIENKCILFRDILGYVPKSSLEKSVLSFCKAWLSGQPSFIVHTSGSTGKPKPIELTREQMEVSAYMTAKALGLKKGDNALVCLNTDYIAGKMMLVRGLVLGMNLYVVPPRRQPLSLLNEQVSIDFVALVPMQLQSSLESDTGTLKKCKAVIVGGAAVSLSLKTKIRQFDLPVFETYGMTETVTHIALKNLRKDNDFFKILPDVHIKQDERGCLQIKSKSTLSQWVITNDIVEIRNNQFFKWLGRADDVINSGGIKIHPAQVEQHIQKALCLLMIDRNFIVKGKQDGILGEKLILIIEGSPLSKEIEKNLFEELNHSIQTYQIPKEVYYISEFARTPNNKLDRQKIGLT